MKQANIIQAQALILLYHVPDLILAHQICDPIPVQYPYYETAEASLYCVCDCQNTNHLIVGVFSATGA